MLNIYYTLFGLKLHSASITVIKTKLQEKQIDIHVVLTSIYNVCYISLQPNKNLTKA